MHILKVCRLSIISFILFHTTKPSSLPLAAGKASRLKQSQMFHIVCAEKMVVCCCKVKKLVTFRLGCQSAISNWLSKAKPGRQADQF